MCFSWSIWRNQASPRFAVEKERTILIAFQIPRHTSLQHYTKTWWHLWQLLKGDFNLKLYLCHTVSLKSSVLTRSLRGSPSMHDCVTLYTDHLENIGSLSYAECPNAHPFYYTGSKQFTFINVTTNLTKKLRKNWKAIKLIVVGCKFSKILIFVWKPVYYVCEYTF